MKKGWQSLKLSDITLEVKGTAEIQGGETYQLWSVPSFSEGGPEIVDGAAIKSAKRPVQEGDVLLCKINPRINRVWVVGESNGLAQVASTEWITLRPKDKATIFADYLQHYLASPSFREWITSDTKGATGSHTRAKPNEVLRRTVPVPPLPEQRRIVAILDEAFEGIAAAKANAERNLRIARELFASQRECLLSGVEQGWGQKPLGDLCEIKHGFAFKSKYFTDDGDSVCLTPGNFFEDGGYRDRGDKTKYYSGPVPEGFVLSAGQMLVAMTEQAPGLLGSPAIVPEGQRFLHNQRLGLICPKEGNPWVNDFFFHVFNRPSFRKAVHRTATGVKVRHTSPSKLGQIAVSFPTSEREQLKVAAAINALQHEVECHQEPCRRKTAALDELKTSLLHQAFTGQL